VIAMSKANNSPAKTTLFDGGSEIAIRLAAETAAGLFQPN
jgi:hypothetical protein